MNKFLVQLTLTLVIGTLVQLFLPWWSLVVVAAIIGLFFKYKYDVMSFLAGFVAIDISWFIYAFWLSSGSSTLPEKMGELLGGVSPFTLVLMSAFIGAMAGGLGALTGSMGRKLVA